MVSQRYSQQKAAKEGQNELQKKRHWRELVPKELHDFGHIFNEKAAMRLPQHRSWDMRIDLVPGQPLPVRVLPPTLDDQSRSDTELSATQR